MLAPNDFRPEAFGRRTMAGAGVRSRSFVLLAVGHEFVHKLIAGLGVQRGHVLVNLRIGTG